MVARDDMWGPAGSFLRCCMQDWGGCRACRMQGGVDHRAWPVRARWRLEGVACGRALHFACRTVYFFLDIENDTRSGSGSMRGRNIYIIGFPKFYSFLQVLNFRYLIKIRKTEIHI